MPLSDSIPYTFTDFRPGQAPQPIAAAQLNANFAAVSSFSSSITIQVTGSLVLSTTASISKGVVIGIGK